MENRYWYIYKDDYTYTLDYKEIICEIDDEVQIKNSDIDTSFIKKSRFYKADIDTMINGSDDDEVIGGTDRWQVVDVFEVALKEVMDYHKKNFELLGSFLNEDGTWKQNLKD